MNNFSSPPFSPLNFLLPNSPYLYSLFLPPLYPTAILYKALSLVVRAEKSA